MNNTNTKLLLLGACVALRRMERIGVLSESEPEVYKIHCLEVPPEIHIPKTLSWTELNRGRLSKRGRRK